MKPFRLNPDYALSYYNRAAVYLNQGQRRQAARDAQTACSLGDCTILDLQEKRVIADPFFRLPELDVIYVLLPALSPVKYLL